MMMKAMILTGSLADFRFRASDSVCAALQRAIERRSRLSVCGGPRIDYVDYTRNGATVYEMTLGRSLGAGQGYEPREQVRVRVSEVSR